MNSCVVDANSVICPHFYYHYARDNWEESINSFISDMKLIINQVDHFALVFDPPKKLGPTVRKAKYPEYKAGRKPQPPEIKTVFNTIWNQCKDNGVKSVYMHPYEADDLVASLAKFFLRNNKGPVGIWSRDKDMLQCTDGVDINMIDISLDENSDKVVSYTNDLYVFNKFGIYPNQMLDYLCMVGDSSDNIPGVKGIGEQKAKYLLNNYKNWDGIVEAAKKRNMHPKLGAKVLAGMEQYKFANSMIKPIDDISIPWKINTFHTCFVKRSFLI